MADEDGGEGNPPIKGHLRLNYLVLLFIYIYIYINIQLQIAKEYIVPLAHFYIYLYISYMYFTVSNNHYI